MKQNILYKLRKKGLLICLLFTTLFIADVYAQYGTSRRVARRTSRRTSNRHAAYNNGGYNQGYGGGAGYVTTLPGGCMLRAISGINYQYCSGVYYQPFYQGTEVVYQQVEIDD